MSKRFGGINCCTTGHMYTYTYSTFLSPLLRDGTQFFFKKQVMPRWTCLIGCTPPNLGVGRLSQLSDFSSNRTELSRQDAPNCVIQISPEMSTKRLLCHVPPLRFFPFRTHHASLHNQNTPSSSRHVFLFHQRFR